MITGTAITCDPNDDLCGSEVIIIDGKIRKCPGCTTPGVHVIKNEDFGLYFIGNHNITPLVGSASPCNYSGVSIKIASNNQQETGN